MSLRDFLEERISLEPGRIDNVDSSLRRESREECRGFTKRRRRQVETIPFHIKVLNPYRAVPFEAQGKRS